MLPELVLTLCHLAFSGAPILVVPDLLMSEIVREKGCYSHLGAENLVVVVLFLLFLSLSFFLCRIRKSFGYHAIERCKLGRQTPQMIFVFFCLLQDKVVGIREFIRRVGLDIQSIIFFVGRAIIGFWVLLRFCLKMRLGNLGRPTRITTRWRFGWQKVGFIALLLGLPVDCVGLIGWL